jgi:hypothetical protein
MRCVEFISFLKAGDHHAAMSHFVYHGRGCERLFNYYLIPRVHQVYLCGTFESSHRSGVSGLAAMEEKLAG